MCFDLADTGEVVNGFNVPAPRQRPACRRCDGSKLTEYKFDMSIDELYKLVDYGSNMVALAGAAGYGPCDD
jgi:hypothetical protein